MKDDSEVKTVSLDNREQAIYNLGVVRGTEKAYLETAKHLADAHKFYTTQITETESPITALDTVGTLLKIAEQFNEQASKAGVEFRNQVINVLSMAKSQGKPTLLDRLKSAIINAKDGFLTPV